jgi:hypothetical protein
VSLDSRKGTCVELTSPARRASQMLLATSCDFITLKKRGSTMRRRTWQASSALATACDSNRVNNVLIYQALPARRPLNVEITFPSANSDLLMFPVSNQGLTLVHFLSSTSTFVVGYAALRQSVGDKTGLGCAGKWTGLSPCLPNRARRGVARLLQPLRPRQAGGSLRASTRPSSGHDLHG